MLGLLLFSLVVGVITSAMIVPFLSVNNKKLYDYFAISAMTER
ncbi:MULTISPECIES: hypothetical protein [unclassified Sporosarcina]|nr:MULTISPECIES: hypothetical protein [unclassified Sporosarcina]